jgi:hypothetical protein
MFKYVLIGAVAMAALAHSTVIADTMKAKDTFKVGHLVIERPWSRAVIKTAKTAVAYFSIKNTGSQPDRLIGATSGVSSRATLHNNIMRNNMMMMRRVKAIEVPAGGSVALKPGGLHLMFEGLHKRFKRGQSFSLTLEFAKAGKVEVMVEVKSLGHRGNGGHGGHSMKPMKGRGKNTTPSHPK